MINLHFLYRQQTALPALLTHMAQAVVCTVTNGDAK